MPDTTVKPPPNEADVFLAPSQREPPQYPAMKPGEPVPLGTLPYPAIRVVVPEKPVQPKPEYFETQTPPRAPTKEPVKPTSPISHKGPAKG